MVTFTESGYKVDGYKVTVTGSATAHDKTSATARADYPAGEAEFVNTYEEELTLDLNIVKVDATDPQKTLTGAAFELHRYDKMGDSTYTDIWPVEYVDSNGKLTFTGLKEGFYKLVEKAIPTGYVKTSADPWFEVKKEDGQLTVRVKEDEKTILYAPDTKTLTVKNEPGVVLPATGGEGTRRIYLIGLTLLFLAGALLLLRRRSGNRC